MFPTILDYFRQILVAFKYFVQSDWLIIVQNLELPYNVKLKIQVVTDRIPSGFEVGFVLLNLQFSVLYFVDHCLSFCPFSFGHCIACPSIYDFRQPFWHLQTFLICWPIHAPLSQLSNLFHCNIYVKNILKITIIWHNELFNGKGLKAKH